MRVLFLQNIKGVAQIGDIKNVSDGYARNFLLPRKLARSADQQAEKLSETLRVKRSASDQERKARAELLVKTLSELSLDFQEDANAEGHLYGSIDGKKISTALKRKGIIVDPEDIVLEHHLKTVGEQNIPIELYPGIIGQLKINIQATKDAAE